MAIIREIIVDRIDTTVSRVLQIRFKKQLVDAGNVLSFEYHRTTLEPGMPLNTQVALVNAHLTEMGWPVVSVPDTERVRAIVQVEHTPAAIAEYRAKHPRDGSIPRG